METQNKSPKFWTLFSMPLLSIQFSSVWKLVSGHMSETLCFVAERFSLNAQTIMTQGGLQFPENILEKIILGNRLFLYCYPNDKYADYFNISTERIVLGDFNAHIQNRWNNFSHNSSSHEVRAAEHVIVFLIPNSYLYFFRQPTISMVLIERWMKSAQEFGVQISMSRPGNLRTQNFAPNNIDLETYIPFS